MEDTFNDSMVTRLYQTIIDGLHIKEDAILVYFVIFHFLGRMSQLGEI